MSSHVNLPESVRLKQHAEARSRHLDRQRPTSSSSSFCLIPFDRREGLTTTEAAARANRTERTIRMWCRDHDIGRRVAGGPWLVSKVALAMLLDDDAAALRSYLGGDRRNPSVAAYFGSEGLADLIDR